VEDYKLSSSVKEGEHISSQTLSNNIWVCLPQTKGKRCLAEEFSLLQDMEDLPKISSSNEKATIALLQFVWQ